MASRWGRRGVVAAAAAGVALALAGCARGPKEPAAPEGREALLSPWSEPAATPVSRYDKAKALYHRGRYPESAAAFEKWLNDYAKNPLEPAALYFLARAQFRAGRKTDAMATCARLEKDYAKTDWATYASQDLAGLKAEQPLREYPRRRRWWNPVDWLRPEPQPVQDFEAARRQYRARRFEEAVVGFRTLAETDPKSPLAPASWYYAARSYELLGQVDKARETYQHVAATYTGSEWELLAQEDLRRLRPE